ncbi:MAG: hypothetical protein GXO75_00485 [Calditrichaeota bacterium]|nr:hypothetical protein [Calditrichota bacterium]
MKPFLKVGIGIFAGGILGFAYYHFIGCQSGTCPLTSNPFITTGYGAVIGLLITSGGSSKSKKEED